MLVVTNDFTSCGGGADRFMFFLGPWVRDVFLKEKEHDLADYARVAAAIDEHVFKGTVIIADGLGVRQELNRAGTKFMIFEMTPGVMGRFLGWKIKLECFNGCKFSDIWSTAWDVYTSAVTMAFADYVNDPGKYMELMGELKYYAKGSLLGDLFDMYGWQRMADFVSDSAYNDDDYDPDDDVNTIEFIIDFDTLTSFDGVKDVVKQCGGLKEFVVPQGTT